jgi:hypothetical protein
MIAPGPRLCRYEPTAVSFSPQKAEAPFTALVFRNYEDISVFSRHSRGKMSRGNAPSSLRRLISSGVKMCPHPPVISAARVQVADKSEPLRTLLFLLSPAPFPPPSRLQRAQDPEKDEPREEARCYPTFPLVGFFSPQPAVYVVQRERHQANVAPVPKYPQRRSVTGCNCFWREPCTADTVADSSMFSGMGTWATTYASREHGNEPAPRRAAACNEATLTFRAGEFARSPVNPLAVYAVGEFLDVWGDGQTMGSIRWFCPAIDPWNSYRLTSGRLCGCNWAKRCC